MFALLRLNDLLSDDFDGVKQPFLSCHIKERLRDTLVVRQYAAPISVCGQQSNQVPHVSLLLGFVVLAFPDTPKNTPTR